MSEKVVFLYKICELLKCFRSISHCPRYIACYQRMSNLAFLLILFIVNVKEHKNHAEEIAHLVGVFFLRK